MVDIVSEQPLPLSKIARQVPNRQGGKGINVATVWRWANRGCKGIKLEVVQIGGIQMSSADALARFFNRLTAAANGESAPAPAPTSRQRAKAIDAAERELAKAGI
ncbi:MAG: DUF1580 domain-containing protein [Planctomycetes bacterium]|nr:DUF1580 domain-containing protein [Planctomycetota bacterium]